MGGATGCGKSSLQKLLCNINHPTEGKVLIDNISTDYYQQHLDHLWRNISLVDQECTLLKHDLSIRENIAIGAGDENASEIEIRHAAAFVGLDGEISLDADVTELSGGQKQLVVCARAILKTIKQGSKILILDEATSALDPISTIKFLKNLKSFQKEYKCTIIFVTHNPTVMKACDSICMLANKTIA